MTSVAGMAAAKGGLAVDVICIQACTHISSTEFFMKFPEAKIEKISSGASSPTAGYSYESASASPAIPVGAIPVNLYVGKRLLERVSAVVVPADHSVHFIGCGADNGLSHFPSGAVLELFGLQRGRNSVSCGSDALGFVEFSIFLWDASSRIVVVDVDGTLTRSSVRGYIETVFLGTYDYIHVGAVPFLLFLDKLGLKILYLSARPRSHLEETQTLLRNMTENGSYLPAGPLFTHDGGRMKTLYMELISETTASFKQSVLQEVSGVYRRVAAAGASGGSEHKPSGGGGGDAADMPRGSDGAAIADFVDTGYIYKCPFILGIGNKDTDARAYYCAGISLDKIFIMQKSGVVVTGGYIPLESDYLACSASRSAAIAAPAPSPDDIAAAGEAVKTIAAASTMIAASFVSYEDPNLLLHTKNLILASSKALNFGDQNNEGV
jgi:hypothetical protein